MYIGIRVKYPSLLSDFNGNLNFPDGFYKILNTKCLENPSSMNRVVPRGGTDERADRHDESNSRFSHFWEST